MYDLIMGNKLGVEHSAPTSPIKITSLFINALFDMNLNFSSRETFSFRERGGPERLKDHVTHADLQLAFTLFRCCNTYGYLELSNRKAIYRRLELEFEVPISEGQFYVAIEKFLAHQLITTEQSADGEIRYRLNYFMNKKKNTIGHYVLFHPFIFSKAFHELTLAAKKLIISAYTQTSGSSHKVITRNLKQKFGAFKHVQFSGLLLFLHKTQKSHVSSLLDNLKTFVAPVSHTTKQHLFECSELQKATLGHKAVLKFNPEFLIPVRKEDSTSYFKPIDACSMFTKFYAFLKREADAYGVGDILADREIANRLVRNLRFSSKRLIRHALHELKSFVKVNGSIPRNPEYFIKDQITAKFDKLLSDVLTKTNAHEFVRFPETKEEEVKERYFTFSYAAAKSKLGIKKLKARLSEVVQDLSTRYPIKEWGISDYGAPPESYPYKELASYINLDYVKEQAVSQQADPFYYADLEYNASIAIRNKDPKLVEEWIIGEISRLPKSPGQRALPYNFRLEKYLFSSII